MKKRKKIGLPPGSVVFTGQKKVEKVLIEYLQYDADKLSEKSLDNQKSIVFNQSSDEQVDWYDIRGLHDTNLLETIGKMFEIHPLVLEDIAEINQRPKFEEYEKGIFIIIRALDFDKEKLKVKTEQIALFFRRGLLFSFQETESDIFATIRNRIQVGHGRIRRKGADYLAYAILDAITDNYFQVLDKVEEAVEEIEDSILNNPDTKVKARIHNLKKELLIIRKSISPLREAISRFTKSEHEFIDEGTMLYVRDLYDHTIQVMDMTENYRDMLNGLQDLYISEISFKMNQVMQVLTVVTTIFVPLSFLTGLYGMNFEYIPELKYQNGYFVLWAAMLLISVGLLYYFKRRNWF